MEPRPGASSEDADLRTAADSEPQHCVLLRAGGQMSVLDMAQGLHLHEIRAILCATMRNSHHMYSLCTIHALLTQVKAGQILACGLSLYSHDACPLLLLSTAAKKSGYSRHLGKFQLKLLFKAKYIVHNMSSGPCRAQGLICTSL